VGWSGFKRLGRGWSWGVVCKLRLSSVFIGVHPWLLYIPATACLSYVEVSASIGKSKAAARGHSMSAPEARLAFPRFNCGTTDGRSEERREGKERMRYK